MDTRQIHFHCARVGTPGLRFGWAFFPHVFAGSLVSQFPRGSEPYVRRSLGWWLCTYVNCSERLCPGLLQPPSSICLWPYSLQPSAQRPLSTWGGEGWVPTSGHPVAEALCRDELGSSWSCWLWRVGLARQLSSHPVFPPSTPTLRLIPMAQPRGPTPAHTLEGSGCPEPWGSRT